MATLCRRELKDWRREASRVLSPAWRDASREPFCSSSPRPLSSTAGGLAGGASGWFQAPD